MEGEWGDRLKGNYRAPDQRGWSLIKDKGSRDRRMEGDEFFFFGFLKDFIYLFMRDIQREAEIQAEGEAGFLRGA